MGKYKDLIAELYEGHEVWTDNLPHLGDRVCVGIVVEDGVPKIMDGGVTHRLSERVAKLLWNDFIFQEYGTTDFETIRKIEGFGRPEK